MARSDEFGFAKDIPLALPKHNWKLIPHALAWGLGHCAAARCARCALPRPSGVPSAAEYLNMPPPAEYAYSYYLYLGCFVAYYILYSCYNAI